MMERFDTELFIDEVEKRPTIWDMECEEYSNKIKKKRAWQEMVEIFADEGDSLDKKDVIGTTLQKKWKNLRDAYNKELKKNKSAPSASGAPKSSTYIFFSRLSFLQKCTENRLTTSNTEDNTKETDYSSTEALEIRPIPKKRKTMKEERLEGNIRTSVEERLTKMIEKSILSRVFCHEPNMNEDEDKMFCLSLYKELRNVPEKKRLATKIELLNVLQRAQTPINTPKQVGLS